MDQTVPCTRIWGWGKVHKELLSPFSILYNGLLQSESLGTSPSMNSGNASP